MDRLLRILFAFLVVIGATGAELQVPGEHPDMDCPVSADGTCPCGMPMPDPSSCGAAVPAPMAAPLRTTAAVVECATAADKVLPEPRPWPAAWALVPGWKEERFAGREPVPADTGPPLPASERAAHLRVFRI